MPFEHTMQLAGFNCMLIPQRCFCFALLWWRLARLDHLLMTADRHTSVWGRGGGKKRKEKKQQPTWHTAPYAGVTASRDDLCGFVCVICEQCLVCTRSLLVFDTSWAGWHPWGRWHRCVCLRVCLCARSYRPGYICIHISCFHGNTMPTSLHNTNLLGAS